MCLKRILGKAAGRDVSGSLTPAAIFHYFFIIHIREEWEDKIIMQENYIACLKDWA